MFPLRRRVCVKIICRRHCQWKDGGPKRPNTPVALIKSCAKLSSLSLRLKARHRIRRSTNTSACLQSPLVCPALKNLNWNFFFFQKKEGGIKGKKKKNTHTAAVPPPPVTACQNAIFQIRLYLDNLLNCNRFPAGRHITIGTSLLNKSDTEPSLCRRRQINVRHRANNISSASRVSGLSLGCYIGFISLSAGEGLLTEVSKFMSSPYV